MRWLNVLRRARERKAVHVLRGECSLLAVIESDDEEAKEADVHSFSNEHITSFPL